MICENCGEHHSGEYASGRFCTPKCSYAFSTKAKRKEINEKVSHKLIGRKTSNETRNKLSKNNGSKREEVRLKIGKGVKQSFTSERRLELSEIMKNRIVTDETRNKLSLSSKRRCSTLEEKIRMREIGRSGGFGNKGYTSDGTYYQSNLEKSCFEYLEKSMISFIPHKNIPNSSKISDIYFPNLDLWIEIDGINREKRKKWLTKSYQYWLEKLEIYESQNLNYVIVYSLTDLINLIKNKNI
ncbi:Nuclease associated modular domain 3 [uncultured Caudovirales phage]|uniref:Nuclease associated modular domain 3 n=1 Tax=uncultured Caudovirales phage TaxID=2100421 RepID=A0A6J5NVY3_9CAUD|nr:Nuclease associated modular domain 3 [uncultured Caudovirales phage]